MDLLLSNKIAIFTSASQGIGKAIAVTLSAEGIIKVSRLPADPVIWKMAI